MEIDLSPNLVAFLQSVADKNGITPEDVVAQIIQTEVVGVQKRENDKRRNKAPINLALLESTKFIAAIDQGKEARQKFDINKLDEKSDPVLVFVPDDLTMTKSFFTGLFDQSIMLLGPKKFFSHYVFDADVGNLQLINRYVRMIWETVKDIELYRLTVHIKGEDEASYTAWLKIRDDDTLEVYDETPVGDFLSHRDAITYVEAQNGRIVEDAHFD